MAFAVSGPVRTTFIAKLQQLNIESKKTWIHLLLLLI